MRVVISLLVMGIACGPRQTETLPKRHLSVAQHDAEAARHDRNAQQYETRASDAEYERNETSELMCEDNPLVGVTYSGGEPITALRPCWTSLSDTARHYRDLAADQRKVAAEHRRRAKTLVEAERASCSGLGENEIAQSPFWQRPDILAVEEHRVGGALRGARIEFRKVPGLSRDWMVTALACHRARAAVLGFPMKFMSFSPMSLPDVNASVTDADDAIVVTIVSPRDEIAAAVLGRARDLASE